MHEVWSRRFKRVNMWKKASGNHRGSNKARTGYKTLTHRHERQTARAALRQPEDA